MIGSSEFGEAKYEMFARITLANFHNLFKMIGGVHFSYDEITIICYETGEHEKYHVWRRLNELIDASSAKDYTWVNVILRVVKVKIILIYFPSVFN